MLKQVIHAKWPPLHAKGVRTILFRYVLFQTANIETVPIETIDASIVFGGLLGGSAFIKLFLQNSHSFGKSQPGCWTSNATACDDKGKLWQFG